MKGNTISSNSQINRNLVADNLKPTASVNTISNSDMDNEWEVIQTAKQNPAQFRILYDKYYVPIFRFVLKRVGEEEIAADITS